MRLLIFALLQLLIFSPIASFAADSVKPLDTQNIQKAVITKSYGKLPLYFIENKGQVDNAVKFYEKGAGHSTFFTEEGVVLTLTKSEARDEKKTSLVEPGLKKLKNKKFTTEALRLSFVGANKGVKITSTSPLPGHVNYFVGNDKTKWQSNIPTYKAVTYENIYDNIDVKFYGNNRDIEHDIIVRPGADPSVVRFAYEGIKGLKIADNGDLKVSLLDGIIIEKRPIIYQVINGERKSIKGSYRILKDADGLFSYGYDIASYDHTKKIVIDPVLVYSTYLGGSNDDVATDIAVDASGNVYVTGFTLSVDFPLASPIQPIRGGYVADVFITKINATGSAIIYSTFLGGKSNDSGNAIAVDSGENVYITGSTGSFDFPVLLPIQSGLAFSTDAFITKIDSTGSNIIFSTYLGGNNYTDSGYDIAVDAAGNVYVTGEANSRDFPLINPIQAFNADAQGLAIAPDAFITKINAAGSALVYSTYLGGFGVDRGRGIAVDASGAVYITGEASSMDFPVVNPIQGTNRGGFSGFVTKINPAGSAIVYSTYLGGSITDFSNAIAVDDLGAAYVTGVSISPNFPLVSPIQGFKGSFDAFISKINPAGSALVYSTYLGGSGSDWSTDITIDASGGVYITGNTDSIDFPLVRPIQEGLGGGTDVFVTKIDPAGSAFLFSTYLGGTDASYNSFDYGYGITVDDSGAIYITGSTDSHNFPLLAPIQGVFGGWSRDAFITKIGRGATPVVSLNISPDAFSVAAGSVIGYTVTITNTTAARQCFHYWENLTLRNGYTYPVTGELFGPIRRCLDARSTQTTHLTHGVPLTAPLGSYALNAFVGAYAFPVFPVVVNETHFTFDVTALGPVTKNPQTSWRLIKNGLK